MTGIDSIQINFNPDQLFLLNICLAFLMFGVALDLRVDNFRALAKAPRKPLIGLFSQWILLPILTMGLVFILRPPPSIALGMILIAACPGGNVSNYAVHLSGSNSALSVLMTSVSTMAAVIITPLYFTWLAPLIPGTEAVRQAIYVSPSNMVSTIIQLILLPLLLGMALNHFSPKITRYIKQPVRVISMIVFLSFVVFAIYGNFDNLVNYLHLVFFLVLIHNTLALLTGYGFARLNKLNKYDARTICIETGIQNSGLGLILVFNFFNGLGGMALITAWWGVWHLISAFTLALWWKRRPIIAQQTSSV